MIKETKKCCSMKYFRFCSTLPDLTWSWKPSLVWHGWYYYYSLQNNKQMCDIGKKKSRSTGWNKVKW